MAVEALVCDASGTLLTSNLTPQPGVTDMLARLAVLGVQVVVAANHPEKETRRQLSNAGLLGYVDHVVAHGHVGKNKGSGVWVDAFKAVTGLEANQLFYVGNTQWDMITATRGPIVYAHSAWSGTPPYPYGLVAPSPGWVAAVIHHIFRKQHNWYWTLQEADPGGKPVNTVTLLDANGAGGDRTLRSALLALFKDNRDTPLGSMTLKQFVMLHMLASLNNDGDFAAAQMWTTYPGHKGAPNEAMREFLDVAAKLARNRYKEDLLIRHTEAEKSNVVFHRPGGGFPAALRNQLETMQVGVAHRGKLTNRRVLLLDNFLTWGSTTEAGRNMLLAAGAASVKVACVGKYGDSMYVAGGFTPGWDPSEPTSPPPGFRYGERPGTKNSLALEEFAASYAAMAKERW